MKTKTVYLLTAYLLFLQIQLCSQQNYEHSYRIINRSDGLAALLSNKVFETSDGYLWVATQNGLARFDGKQFKMFYSFYADSNTITGNSVIDLEEDLYHRLWVGSFTNGLAIFDIKKNTWLQYKHPTADENPTYRILDVHRDKDNIMWVGTMGRGLLQYDYGQKKFIQYLLNKGLTTNGNNPDDNTVRKIADDPYDKNILWLACMDGLYRFDKNTKQLTQFENKKNGKKDWKDNCFHAILTPPGNTIWLGTWGGGVITFNRETGLFANYPYKQKDYLLNDLTTNVVLDLFPVSDTSLYVASGDQGLLEWNKLSHKFYPVITPQSLGITERAGSTVGISATSGNCIWVCGMNNVYLFNKIYSRFGNWQPIHQDEADHISYAELYDALWLPQSNNYWLACISKNGIPEYDSSFHFTKFIPVAGRQSNLTVYRCLRRDHEDRVWIQTTTAPFFYFYSASAKSFQPVNNFVPGERPDGPISRFVIDKKDRIWTATDSFLVEHDIIANTTKKFSFKPDPASHLELPLTAARITLDNYGKLWIASNIGLWSFDPATETWQHIFPDKKKEDIHLADADIGCIAVDRNGKIWVGPSSQGLQVYDPARKKFERSFHVSTDPSFHSTGVTYLQSAPDGNVWACTYNGLAVWERDKEQWEWFYQRDGLMKDYVDQPMMIMPNGKALLAQYNGFVAFDTKHWQRNEFTPRLKITGMNIDDLALPVNDSVDQKKITVKASQKRVAISFTAIEPLFPDRLQYWYQLKGYDDQWRITSQNQVEYAALPPGSYTFYIKAQNSDGKWSRLLEIPMEVSAPFWKQWWFIPAVLIVAVLIFYALYRYRLSQVLKVQQLRNHISRDLHDEIGSSVSSINMLSVVAKKQIEGGHPLTGLLSQIGQSASQAGESIDEIVWSINPRFDVAHATFNRLRSYASNLFESVGIDYSIELPDLADDIKMDAALRQDVWLICKEAINNIIKYSSCKKAIVQIKWENNFLDILIADDGKGFDVEEAMKKNRSGLRNMRARAEKYKKGVFEMRSGAGTTVHCLLPVKRYPKMY